ncbi:MAG: hypothetical protein IKC83_02485 [Clostridia bacterium]|nr:hypothetical protein [Clostridia bacterium]
MSYRLQSEGEFTPDVFRAGYLDYTVGGKDGYVEGILDELKITQNGYNITIGRGKLMVSGYPVLFEGKEVIGVPADYPDDKYMIVGVLTVSGYKAKSFYLSLRKLGDVRCDDVNKSGEGVYEIKIAQFTIFYKKLVSLKNLLTKIYAKPEQVGPTDFEIEVRGNNAKNIFGKVNGSCNVSDSQSGYFTDFKLVGKTSYDGEKIISVPSNYTLKVHGKNYLDIRYIYDYEENTDYVISVGNLENGYMNVDDSTVCFPGLQQNEEDVLSRDNGFVQLLLNDLEAGKDYTLSFKGYLSDYTWETNEQNAISVVCSCGEEEVKNAEYNMHAIPEELYESPKKDVAFTFTALRGVHVIDIRLGGLYLNVQDIQLEQSTVYTGFEQFKQTQLTFDIVDKQGNRYELDGIDGDCDTVEVRGGKVVLVKRTGKGMGYITEIKFESNYITKNGVFPSENEEINAEEGEEVVFVKGYEEVIELDIDLQKWNTIPTYEPCTVISIPSTAGLPAIQANYGKNLVAVINALEERIKAIENKD